MKSKNGNQLNDKNLESVSGGIYENGCWVPDLCGMPIACKTKEDALDFCNEMKKYDKEKYEDLAKRIQEGTYLRRG